MNPEEKEWRPELPSPSDSNHPHQSVILWLLLTISLIVIVGYNYTRESTLKKPQPVNEIVIRIDAKDHHIKSIEDQQGKPITNMGFASLAHPNGPLTEWQRGYFDGLDIALRASTESIKNGKADIDQFYRQVISQIASNESRAFIGR